MKSKIFTAWHIFRYLYDVVFFSILAFTVQVAMIKETPAVYVIFYIAVPLLLSYLLRGFAPNNALLIGGHVLLAALAVWSPGPVWIRTVSALLLVCYLIPVSVSYVKRGCKPASFSEPWPSILTVVFLYIGGLACDQDVFANLAYGATILMTCDYFLIRYTQGLFRYTEQIIDVSGLPVRTVVSVNNRFVAGLVILTALLMAACRFLNLDFLVKQLATALSWIINMLLTGIMLFYVFFLTLLTGNGEQMSDTELAEELYTHTASYETSHIGEVIAELFAIIILVFFLYKILLAVVRFLTAPRIREKRTERNPDERRIVTERESIPKTKTYAKPSNERLIRQAYRNMVLSYRRDISLTSKSTCDDIQNEIQTICDGDTDAATKVYESVRYGNMTADRRLVKTMNRLAKQGRKR